MSSLSLSAIESLLRITVATPVSAATLPIGSSDAAGVGGGVGAGAGVAAGAGAGVGTGWACAIRVGLGCDAPSTSAGAGIEAKATPVGGKPRKHVRTHAADSQSANQSRCDVTEAAPWRKFLKDGGSKEPG